MSEFKGTPHNSALVGEIAETVLMPGDPLRAKFIAENFLDKPKQFNKVRGMLGYTGYYKGVKVSVMGSGMGIPSISLYSYELFNFYNVKNIIRVGTCGGMDPRLTLFDVIIGDSSYSRSSFANVAYGFEGDLMLPDETLVAALEQAAQGLDKKYFKGCINASDVFYSKVAAKPCDYHLLGAEMESFGLYATAKASGKRAATVLTVSDMICEGSKHEETTAEQRQTAFTDMMEIALNTAVIMDNNK